MDAVMIKMKPASHRYPCRFFASIEMRDGTRIKATKPFNHTLDRDSRHHPVLIEIAKQIADWNSENGIPMLDDKYEPLYNLDNWLCRRIGKDQVACIYTHIVQL
jgi:hypothetical protein